MVRGKMYDVNKWWDTVVDHRGSPRPRHLQKKGKAHSITVLGEPRVHTDRSEGIGTLQVF